MSDKGYEDSTNKLEVEITDLDASYGDGKVVNAYLLLQRYLAKMRWELPHSSLIKVSLLIAILILPLFIGTSYESKRATTLHSGNQLHCITRLNQIIIYDGTVTPRSIAHVTIVVITQTANASSSSITPSNTQNGTAPWQTDRSGSSSCK